MQYDYDASMELTNKKRLLHYFPRMGFGVPLQSKIIGSHLKQDQEHGLTIFSVTWQMISKIQIRGQFKFVVLKKARPESQILSVALGLLLQLKIWPRKLKAR